MTSSGSTPVEPIDPELSGVDIRSGSIFFLDSLLLLFLLCFPAAFIVFIHSLVMGKKELLKSAPWRVDPEEDDDVFKDAKLKVTNQPGSTPTMHVPGKKHSKNGVASDDNDLTEIDPELRYSFQRNFQFLQRVFSMDTIVKPLPPAMAYSASRNLNFFTRIFTQFFDPEGIFDAQKSLGLGQEEKMRKVR